MPTPIRITVGAVVLHGELHDGPLAAAVAAALPLEDTLRSYGQAFYIETPIDRELEAGASDRVEAGDIAYWPPALAVVVFFGPTPGSPPGSQRPVAASEVTIIGRCEEPARLAGQQSAARLRIERA